MQPTIEIAAVILGLTALGGLAIAGMRLSGIPRPPTWIALVHGAIGVVGLGTLIVVVLTTGTPLLAQIALGVSALAAIGGLGLFFGFHLSARPLPIPLVLVHGLVALTGLALLLFSMSGRS